jgi:exosortase
MPRTIRLILFTILLLGAFWAPLKSLVEFSLQNESASHILLIPVVSLFLLVSGRARIFTNVRTDLLAGLSLLLAGLVAGWFAHRQLAALGQQDYLSATTVSLLLAWLGLFLLCYGTRSFRAAFFPLLFLLLMIPIPQSLLASAILFLQKGSTSFAYHLFKLCRVPVYRDGFLLSLPGITIEVAQECSGIRSSLALFITALLAGHLYLRRVWTKAVLCSTIVPLVIVKNGLRIAALTLLSLYVDRGFLFGRLHHEGGVVFFLLALGIEVPILWLLWRVESPRRNGAVVDRLQSTGHSTGA